MKKIILAAAFWTLAGTAMSPASSLAQGGENAAGTQELARTMHEIRPLQPQVEMVIDNIAQRVPEENREIFKMRMMEELDMQRLEEVSIEAMAEVFTEAELQRMIGYFGSPEIESIDSKMPIFQQLIQPEITRMVDRALMTVRTGQAGD